MARIQTNYTILKANHIDVIEQSMTSRLDGLDKLANNLVDSTDDDMDWSSSDEDSVS